MGRSGKCSCKVKKFLRENPKTGFSELAELEIQDGETVILYKLGLERSYAWVIGKRGNKNEILKFIRLPITTAEVEKISIKLLMPFIKTKYNEFDLNIAADLFDKILKPVLEGVTISKHLIVIPDGILNVVPFELLVTKIGCGKDFKKPCFFGDQFNVKYYPSATILTFNRQAMPQTSLSHDLLFAVGDPIYSTDDERLDQSQISLLHENENEQKSSVLVRSGRIRKGAQDQCYSFDRLKNTGIEVNKIRDIFKNSYGKEEVLTGYEAREGNVKSKDLTQYRYLHFAVHGMLAYDIPYLKEPALVLGIYPPEDKEDGFLTLSEIYSLRLNADLVTLSACNTGLGFRYAGEGVVGLSRAFMNVGARSVLVSLWEVADESTALFMEEFYRLLNSGMEKTEALEKAKYKLRQMGYENPYFWAPFILIGD
jgi:CHAT domain-containing protein